MIGYYNVSVILTYIGLLSSFFGMANLSVARSNPWAIKIAFLCLLFSGLCDMFDGKIARRTNRSPEAREFGIQIDSLCDLICFGVYPAFIVITISRKHWISMLARSPVRTRRRHPALHILMSWKTNGSIRQVKTGSIIRAFLSPHPR